MGSLSDMCIIGQNSALHTSRAPTTASIVYSPQLVPSRSISEIRRSEEIKSSHLLPLTSPNVPHVFVVGLIEAATWRQKQCINHAHQPEPVSVVSRNAFSQTGNSRRWRHASRDHQTATNHSMAAGRHISVGLLTLVSIRINLVYPIWFVKAFKV